MRLTNTSKGRIKSILAFALIAMMILPVIPATAGEITTTGAFKVELVPTSTQATQTIGTQQFISTKRGENVEMLLKLTELHSALSSTTATTYIDGFTIKISYDKNKLQLPYDETNIDNPYANTIQKISGGLVTNEADESHNTSVGAQSEGYIEVIFTTSTASRKIKTTGDLFKITFVTKADAAPGATIITPSFTSNVTSNGGEDYIPVANLVAVSANVNINTPKTLTSVSAVTTIANKKVSNTDYDAISLGGLPTSVEASYVGGADDTITVPVSSWDFSTFDSTSTAPQDIYGTLNIGTDNMILQPEAPTAAVKAKATVTLLPATYTAADNTAALAALQSEIIEGTATIDAAVDALADTVVLNFRGEGGATDLIPVTYSIAWAAPSTVVYDSTTAVDGDTFTVNSTSFTKDVAATNVSPTDVPTSVIGTINVAADCDYFITSFSELSKATYDYKKGAAATTVAATVKVNLQSVAGVTPVKNKFVVKEISFAVPTSTLEVGQTFDVTTVSLNDYIDGEKIYNSLSLPLPKLTVTVIGLIKQYAVTAACSTGTTGYMIVPVSVKKNATFDTEYTGVPKFAVVKSLDSSGATISIVVVDVSSTTFSTETNTEIGKVRFQAIGGYSVQVELYSTADFGDNMGSLISNTFKWAPSNK